MISVLQCLRDVANWCKTISTKTKIDYIVSQGISGVWFYRKWASGYCELYGCGTVANSTYVQTWMSSMYHCSATINLPFSIKSGRMFYNSQVGSGFGWNPNQSGTKWDSAISKVTLESLGSQKNEKFNYTIHIFGKWK